MLHVLRRDGMVDSDFVDAHTVGYERLDPLLDDCTPEWGEAVTGVPAEAIVRAASDVRRRPVAAVDRSGAPAPAHRRQRGAGVRAAAGGDRQRGQAGRRVPVSQRPARDRLRLPGGAASGGSSSARQPHGPGRPLGAAGARPGPDLLEHQHRRVKSRAGAAAARARPRRPVHGRGRPVRHRHHRSRRHRAAGGQLPGVRRSDDVLLRSHPVGPGEGLRSARRGAAEHRDLPAAGGRHGISPSPSCRNPTPT